MQLSIGKSNRVSFNINVMGSAQVPRVRVIICAQPELSFPAQEVDGKWSVDLSVPSNVAAGSYDFRVEVLLNNRLFSPLSKRVELISQTTEIPAVNSNMIAAKDWPPSTPAMVPAAEPEVQSVFKSIISTTESAIEEKVKSKVEEPLGKLSSLAAKTPKKMYERMSSGMPKGDGAKVEPVKITIAQLEKSLPKVKKQVTVANDPLKQKMKLKESTPIRLIKGTIIYE